MDFIDTLIAEHDLIERAVGALRTYTARRIAGTATSLDAPRFFRFLRVFVGSYHHDREESVLFPALIEQVGVPADRGPIPALLTQHHELACWLDELEALLGSADIEPAQHAAIEALSMRYAHRLWRHIDAENSVLFPESATRLARAGIFELTSRQPTEEEISAADDAERLVRAYPPEYDPSAMRGEGCIFCPSYGSTCEGVERTWWNESEWEQLAGHLE
jgi:hemerythrin-like domain-containing protein